MTAGAGRFPLFVLGRVSGRAPLKQELVRERLGEVVAFYNRRGTAEQWIKEGKHAINWTRLSCHSFRNNEVRLQLHALA